MATDARMFLVPHWVRWHEKWGPPAPATASQWTCVRSSLFLTRALERHGIPAVLQSGRPDPAAGYAAGQQCGLLTLDGWASHAWVEAAGYVIDVTADQFGHAPVIVTARNDPGYRRADSKVCRLWPTPAGIAAVDEIWPSWCRHVDRRFSR